MSSFSFICGVGARTAFHVIEALQCVLLNESLGFQWGGCVTDMWVQVTFEMPARELSFKRSHSCHCHGWVLQTLVRRGLPHYQVCFLFSLGEVPPWCAVLELSEAHVNSLSKGLHLRHRETLCIRILYLYNWHNCICFRNWITDQSKVQNHISNVSDLRKIILF